MDDIELVSNLVESISQLPVSPRERVSPFRGRGSCQSGLLLLTAAAYHIASRAPPDLRLLLPHVVERHLEVRRVFRRRFVGFYQFFQIWKF